MSIASTIKDNVMEWGMVGIVIVIVSVIMLKFKAVSGVTAALNTTIDTFVSALSEPKNWVAIVIIAVIGIGVLGYFYKLKGKKGRG